MGLNEAATKLGKLYVKAKAADKSLKTQRQAFFDEVSESLGEEGELAQKTIHVPEGWTDEEYVVVYYPGWLLVETNGDRSIIEEDPRYVKFSFANPDDGMFYQRNVILGAESLDDVSLRENDPELWDRITAPDPKFEYILQFEEWVEGKTLKRLVQEFLDTLPDERVLRPIESLSKGDQIALQTYIVPGKLTLKLEPVRKAKPEELE